MLGDKVQKHSSKNALFMKSKYTSTNDLKFLLCSLFQSLVIFDPQWSMKGAKKTVSVYQNNQKVAMMGKVSQRVAFSVNDIW